MILSLAGFYYREQIFYGYIAVVAEIKIKLSNSIPIYVTCQFNSAMAN